MGTGRKLSSGPVLCLPGYAVQGPGRLGFWSKAPVVSIPALLCTTCLTLDKFLNLFVAHFPPLSKGHNHSLFLSEVCEDEVRGSTGDTEWCLAQSNPGWL